MIKIGERQRYPAAPVLKMNNPRIRPFYGKITDKKPYLIYGKYDDILKIEKNHMRMVQLECIKSGKKYFNGAGTKMIPEIDQKKVETLVVIDHEMQWLMKKFEITSQKKHGKDGWVMNGKKGDKIHRVSKDKLYQLKTEGIAKLCMVSVDNVKEVVKS